MAFVKKKEKVITKKQKKLVHSTSDIIPYARMSVEGFLMFENGMCQEILQITSHDTHSLHQDEAAYFELAFAQFNRLFQLSYKIVSLKFPSNTQVQQNYWKKRIKEARNEKQRLRCREALERLKVVEKHRSNQEFFLFIYGKNLKELREKVRDAKNCGQEGLNLQDIDKEKKIRLLFKLNNMNTSEF